VAVCAEYKIHNADVEMRGDCDVDDLVDVIEGNRLYVPALYVLNKIDQITLEELEVCCTRSCARVDALRASRCTHFEPPCAARLLRSRAEPGGAQRHLTAFHLAALAVLAASVSILARLPRHSPGDRPHGELRPNLRVP